MSKRKNYVPTRPGVAPSDLLVADFRALDARETLRCAWQTEQNLLIQSIIGHAHEGHGLFAGRRYVNTTMDDIARALRLDPVAVREERQNVIDGVAEYLERAITGGEASCLVDNDGVPLLTMGPLALLPELDGEAVARGFYLGAKRDDSEIRVGAEARYGLIIGGGQSSLVNLDAMTAAGLDAEKLAHQDHSADIIQQYRDAGVIIADEGPDDDDTAYLYIRHRKGCGTSDDACIVLTGLLYGFSAGVGAFLADAVDTIEKYVPVFGGADHNLAGMIEEKHPNLGVTLKDCEDIAYLCADETHNVPDSSLRHLLAVDRRHDQCAAEAHLLYLMARPYAPLGLSHQRKPNAPFYAYCEKRIASWRESSVPS